MAQCRLFEKPKYKNKSLWKVKKIFGEIRTDIFQRNKGTHTVLSWVPYWKNHHKNLTG